MCTYHYCHGIVEFVHGLEVWHLVEIAKVDNSKVLHLLCDSGENIVLAQAVGITVLSKADDYKSFVLLQNSLVDVPAGAQMRQNDGAHADLC